MRVCIFNFRKVVSVFKNKFVLYEKNFFDITACRVVYDRGFAFLKLYMPTAEWICGFTFNGETIEHEV